MDEFGTLAGCFRDAVAADPARPLLTYYDDATGERTELSGATLDNWVAKTANLLVDGLGLGPGDRATVALPPHWQAAAVLLGCWSAGLEVVADRPDVVFALAPDAAGPPARAERAPAAQPARAERAPAARFLLGLAPMALPLREVPDGFEDYVGEVRGYGDRFAGAPVAPDTPAMDGATNAELVARARHRAASLGLGCADRVLVDAGAHPDPLDWLLVPLLAGASIVLCGQLDRNRLPSRQAAERVTRVL
jgi:uncharacterized protein (TIGR03089 family)